MKNIIALIVCLFAVISVNAQINIKIDVTNVDVSGMGDCDGAGDSDPTWWWFGPDIDNRCEATECNDCSLPTSQNLYDETFGCPPPATIQVQYSACEDDLPFVSGCVLGSAATVICDGDEGSRTDDIPLPTVAGTTNFGPFCVDQTGDCLGTFCYSGTITVTGELPPPVADLYCDALEVPVSLIDDGNAGAGVSLENSWCADQTVESWENTATDGSTAGSAWYWFTAPASGNVQIDTYDNNNGTGVNGTEIDDGSLLGTGTELSVYHAANGAGCNPGINTCDGSTVKDYWQYLSWIEEDDLGGPANVSFLAELDLSCNNVGTDGIIPGEVYYIQLSADDPDALGTIEIAVLDLGGGPNSSADIPCIAEDITGLLAATPTTNDASIGGNAINGGNGTEIISMSQSCTNDAEVDQDNAGGPPAYTYDENLTGTNDPDASVWVSFTAPNSGQIYLEDNIVLQGESINMFSPDPLFAPAVPADYSCADLTVRDYTTDVNGGATFGGGTAIITPTCLEPGYTYYAMLDPTTASLGDIDVWAWDPVAVGFAPNPDAAPLNDIMCLALGSATYEVTVNAIGAPGAVGGSGDNTNACIETLAGEPTVGGGNQTVWHYFTVPASGVVDIELQGGTFNFGVYETFDATTGGCYGGLAPRTYTADGNCSITPCATGSAGAGPVTKCCLTPGDVLAIQVDGANAGDVGAYDIIINEIDQDAGNTSYLDPDGDNVDATTATPAAAGPAVICWGEFLTPTSDAVPGIDYSNCMDVGFVLHDTADPNPADATVGPADLAGVTIYGTVYPAAPIVNDGSTTAPLNTVVYVSALADGSNATATWGGLCPSLDIHDAAPVVFLEELTAAAAVTACDITVTAGGGLPAFDGSMYSYTVTGTAISGMSASPIAITAPGAGTYTVVLTDGEGCTVTTSAVVTDCTAAVCGIGSLTLDSVECDPADSDLFIVTCSYAGSDPGTSVTSIGGTVSGDDPAAVADGTIIISGLDACAGYDISIGGNAECDAAGLSLTGAAPACATCGCQSTNGAWAR